MLDNLAQQTVLPYEVVLVDGAPAEEQQTQEVVNERKHLAPFRIHYIRHGGGTAIQRNVGIDDAEGDLIAFIDDDIRLEADYFERTIEAFDQDSSNKVGGITGYIVNQYIDARESARWRWYRRLHLFGTYEPGRFDYSSGYPINRYLQPPHAGLREIDFMGSACAVWRRQVLDENLRFDAFFADYGMLEDAHLALRAQRNGWSLLEAGRARCYHYQSVHGRVDDRRLAWKTAVNYRYVFLDIVPERNWRQETRFWLVQAIQLAQLIAAVLAPNATRQASWSGVRGKLEGMWAALRLKVPVSGPQPDQTKPAPTKVRGH